MIEIGKIAPAFSLPSSGGTNISLKDFKGRIVVLYFYPKDNTPGCTLEACDFRDNMARITATGAIVLGVSADGIPSHQKFIGKYELPFDLLSDENREVIEKYGVWKEKNMYGKKVMGIVRTTVIIDRFGKIARIFPKVKVTGHVDEVIAAIDEMGRQ
jgi:thioredoxin-dependent peroxiredoxin